MAKKNTASPQAGPLKFTLKRKRIPFQLEHADGSFGDYELVELEGSDREAYLNKQQKVIEYDNTGLPTGRLKDYTDYKAFLLHLSIRKMPEDVKVALQDIRKWPGEAQDGLFKEAQELCGFTDASETDAGNS